MIGISRGGAFILTRLVKVEGDGTADGEDALHQSTGAGAVA